MIEELQKGPCKKVHIIFGDSASGSLKVILRDLGVNREEHVITFSDLFSIGPVWELHNEAGQKARSDWFKSRLNYSSDDFNYYTECFQNTLHEIDSIPTDVPVTIWIGENAHEQTGFRYVLHLLNDRANDIFIINTTKAFTEHFSQPEVKYFIVHTGEIAPEKLKIIYEGSKLSEPISYRDRKQLREEWLCLANKQEVLRLWRNREILSVREEYYDQYILNMAKKLHNKQKRKEFIKSARLVGEVLGHLEQYVSDEFLEYRLRMLINKKQFEVEGSLEAMRYYSIQLL